MKSAFADKSIQLASQLNFKDLPNVDPMWKVNWQVSATTSLCSLDLWSGDILADYAKLAFLTR